MAGEVQADEAMLKTMKASSQASQRKEFETCSRVEEDRVGQVHMEWKYTASDVRKWLAAKRALRDARGRPQVRRQQMRVLEKVGDRIICELGQGNTALDPLLWCRHGGPGVGKSKMIHLLKELFEARSDITCSELYFLAHEHM